MGLFRKSKKKKSKEDNNNDTSQFSTEGTEVAAAVRIETAPLREMPSSSERKAKARAQLARMEEERMESLLQAAAHPSSGNWMTRTQAFQEMCDSAFQLIDADGSGEVDEKELYSGLLLIHLKLGTYAGPAACRPLSRERCHAVFLKFDKDNSGCLDRTEFGNVMGVLFGNVLSRVLLQYSLTLLIVPFMAKALVDAVVGGTAAFWGVLSNNLDEHSSWANQMELFLEMIRDLVGGTYRTIAPFVFQTAGDSLVGLLAKIPESVWLSLPLTLTSAILGCLIVPRSIMAMDDLFQRLADKKAKQA